MDGAFASAGARSMGARMCRYMARLPCSDHATSRAEVEKREAAKERRAICAAARLLQLALHPVLASFGRRFLATSGKRAIAKPQRRGKLLPFSNRPVA